MIVLPFVLGFAEIIPAAICFFIASASTLVLSLFTNYELGIWKRLPMTFHLDMDMVLGLCLAISPWLFGFHEQVFLPHVIMGLFAIVSGLITQRNSLLTGVNSAQSM
ncbi:hypothetical protein ASF92_07325 [Pedobacter sp. Leaf176]|nr:hypothetical protein ASF92_07325 [Pedobacter sp. Leaf176]